MVEINRKIVGAQDQKGSARVVGLVAERALVQGLAQHTRASFNELFAKYARALGYRVNQIVKNQALTDDILQEAFVKIWQSIGFYNPQKSRLYTWLLTICQNQALDHLKSKHSRNKCLEVNLADVLTLGAHPVDESYNDNQLWLTELLCFVRPFDKDVVELVYFQGFTHADAAKKMGIPLGTVKTRLRLGLAALRVLIKKDRLHYT